MAWYTQRWRIEVFHRTLKKSGCRIENRRLGHAQAAVTSTLHHAFLTLVVLILVSSLAFWKLRPDDGESVNKGQAAEAI